MAVNELKTDNVEEPQTFGNTRKLQISSVSILQYYLFFFLQVFNHYEKQILLFYIGEERNTFI